MNRKRFLSILILLAILILPIKAQAAYRNLEGSVWGASSEINIKNTTVDKNKKLYAVVGKSKIVNFDMPVKRISIADPQLADIVVLSSKQILLNGKKAGSTSLIFWNNNSKTPISYNLTVQMNADEFLKAVDYVCPNEDISIIFNDKGAVLTGKISTTTSKEKIKELAKAYKIDLVDLSESLTKQVLLEVKVAEVSKEFTRNIGVQSRVGKPIPALDSKTSFGKVSRVLSQDGINYIFSNASNDFSLILKAAETKGDAQILAEPKLLAADGQEASFNAGNEVPVPSSIGQYGQVAYEFKKTGVILKFTPTIMEKTGRIKLKLSPEVSEIDRGAGIVDTQNAVVVPGFKTRKVETTVELKDGETLVIAGLLNNTNSRTRNQVPLLGDIPVLGMLFKTLQDSKNNNELMIFITPKIVDAPQFENL